MSTGRRRAAAAQGSSATGPEGGHRASAHSVIAKWNSVAGRRLLLQLVRGEVRVERALQPLDLQRWEYSWLVWVLGRNRGVRRESLQKQKFVASGLAIELDDLRKRQAQRRSTLPANQRRFRGVRQHLDLLARSLGAPAGGNEWNEWRRKHPHLRPNLRGADLSHLDLNDLQLDHVSLRDADLSGSNLASAALTKTDLRDAQCFNTNFSGADLKESELEGAWLNQTNLAEADLSHAHLGGAFLTDCSLNRTWLEGADLRGTYMWGCSYWGAWIDESTKQSGIRIASDFDWIEFVMSNKSRDPALANKLFDIQIDDLRVADFMWQIKDYPERVAEMINAATSKLVLLLGRFEGEQRAILDEVLVPTLADLHYIPMVFDFKPPDNRDVIESVAILAGLSHFVIADLTDPRSTPLESQLLVPMLAVPFFPIIRRGDRVFSMFADLQRKYPWVQPLEIYRGKKHLVQLLKESILLRAERVAKTWQKRKRRGIE